MLRAAIIIEKQNIYLVCEGRLLDSKKSIMKPSKKRSGIFRSGCQKKDRNRKMSKKMGERHMDYFAHIDGERKQSVLEHSEGVARLA